jgi:hypothetical protein
LVVRTDNVTLDLGGNTLAVASVIVGRDAGDDARLVINGGGTMSLAGALTVAASPGSSGAYTLAAGTLNAPTIAVNNGGTFTHAGGTLNTTNVQLSGNALMTLAPGQNRTLKVSTLNIADASKLDLADNKLIAAGGDLGTFAGGSYSGLTGQIASAYNFSNSDGPGITTSMPDAGAAVGITTLAINTADATFYAGGTFGGLLVASGDVLIMYTYAGDANLDGLVDASDYGIIDNWVQFPGTSGYANGDFNYDGVIDAADYGIIDNAIQLQGPPIPAGTYPASARAVTVAAVPEPSSLPMLGVAAASLLGHRSRRSRRATSRTSCELLCTPSGVHG